MCKKQDGTRYCVSDKRLFATGGIGRFTAGERRVSDSRPPGQQRKMLSGLFYSRKGDEEE